MANIFQRILNKQNSSVPDPNPEPENKPESPEQGYSSINRTTSSSWKLGFAQSVGLQREHNEDAVFLSTYHLAHYNKYQSFGLFIVADGMGGHQYGEIASGTAIKTMSSAVIKKLTESAVEPEGISLSNSEILSLLKDSLLSANEAVKKNVPGGGTTLTAVLIIHTTLFIAHVGDSRVYQLTEDKQLDVLTKDHSFVRQLIDAGQLTPGEAAVHPHRNVLSMALGQIEPLEPQLLELQIDKPSHILLCSDGLWGVVPEDILISSISSSVDPQSACTVLIDQANKAGGPDNITAILIQVPVVPPK